MKQRDIRDLERLEKRSRIKENGKSRGVVIKMTGMKGKQYTKGQNELIEWFDSYRYSDLCKELHPKAYIEHEDSPMQVRLIADEDERSTHYMGYSYRKIKRMKDKVEELQKQLEEEN